MPMRSRLLLAPLVGLLAGVLVLTAAPAYAADPPDGGNGAGYATEAEREADPGRTAQRTDCPQVEIRGRGYGHGAGMSQYGAKARAEAGHRHPRILRFYYPNTEGGRRAGAMKVLITADTTKDVHVLARPGLKLRRRADGKVWHLPQVRPNAKRWRIIPRSGGSRVVVKFKRPNQAWRVFRRFSGTAEFTARGRPIALRTPSGLTRYRGTLRAAELNTVNLLSLENYLKGVVPHEMPALWHPQAVRAQAVAARSYAARERADRRKRYFHVYDDTRSQVYGGFDAEHSAANAAVRDTARRVRLYDGYPAFTQFSASNGGWVVGRPSVPYLNNRRDGFDDYPAWTVCVTSEEISNAWPAIGRFRRIRIVDCDGHGDWGSCGGRVTRVRIAGSDGVVRPGGDQVRGRLGLKSSWFRFR